MGYNLSFYSERKTQHVQTCWTPATNQLYKHPDELNQIHREKQTYVALRGKYSPRMDTFESKRIPAKPPEAVTRATSGKLLIHVTAFIFNNIN